MVARFGRFKARIPIRESQLFVLVSNLNKNTILHTALARFFVFPPMFSENVRVTLFLFFGRLAPESAPGASGIESGTSCSIFVQFFIKFRRILDGFVTRKRSIMIGEQIGAKNKKTYESCV